MLAVSLVMKKGLEKSNNPRDVIGIEILNGNICKKLSVSTIYKFLKNNPDVQIGIKGCNAYLVTAESINGVGYIRSAPNLSTVDSLMRLPRSNV